MSNSALDAARREPHAFLTLAFRPFFLLGALWAALSIVLWVGSFVSGKPLPSAFDPLSWHIHSMLFGFVLAAIAGFLLTAMPNWTGRRPVRGAPLAGLAALWLIGRAAAVTSGLMPLALAAGLDVAFPATLCVVAAREIVVSRNWRNAAIPVPVAALGAGDLLMYLERAGIGVPAGLGWRLGLAAAIALISVVGGRIVPAFTRNWLAKRGRAPLPAAAGPVDRVALGVLHAGLVAWVAAPPKWPVGVLLLLAAALNLWRLARWCGLSTLREPLLFILHVGYAWVVVGTALLGASLVTIAVPLPAGIHALTAGAIGTMVLAVMTRVSLGHTGRPLTADGFTTLIYALVILAGVVRIGAALSPGSYLQLVELSAALWAASFAGFVARYGPMLVAPRADAR
ncbi:MAG TPA: NnrS family protein [Gammaproteobacteria bacterium]|nr:NnrS family protein [Gammaproteobacteria bacterium]